MPDPPDFRSAAFPFPAIVSMETAKTALLLLAVDPGLQGVLIASGPGAAKSVLGSSFRSILPQFPFVEIPLGVTPDRLSGGLDLERTLLTGERQMFDGLLASASGGFLFVDDVNLLDRTSACCIAAALGSGVALIGTYDPGEGEVSGSLFDSIGLHATGMACSSTSVRAEILSRVAAFDRDPVAFAGQHAAEMHSLRVRVAEARGRLPEVKMTVDNRRRLSQAALSLGIASHRADIFAARAACAHAAFMERASVTEEDLKIAVTLVLLPRAGIQSQQPAAAATEIESRSPREAVSEHEQRPDQHPEDLVIQALDCKLPEELLQLARSNGSGPARRRRANGRLTPSWRRGRYVRAVADNPENRSIALEATLRAAAPFQHHRRNSRQPAIQVTARDLRYKQFKQNASILFIFAVDASGSMALNRMNQAKGALIRLLQQAYLHRDKVALISFRSNRAEVLLPPTRSVELARRALDALPAGGGTPLAAGIEAALALARRAQYAGVRQAMLVLFTDGSANVGRGDSPRSAIWHELSEVCAAFRLDGFPSVVIDTRSHLLSGGEAERLAQMLDAKYIYLQRPDGGTVHEAVVAFADTMRQGLNSRPV